MFRVQNWLARKAATCFTTHGSIHVFKDGLHDLHEEGADKQYNLLIATTQMFKKKTN